MSDVMAIISKAVFEALVGKTPVLGTVPDVQSYVSANKGLTPLAGGGTLYLVTVRPPDDALWLVAVLANPVFDGKQWQPLVASTLPMTNISQLKASLVFENGKGLPQEKGKLGMSLQTPRVLAASDIAALAPFVAASRSGGPAPTTSTTRPLPADPSAPLLAAVIAAPTDDAPKRALAAYWTSIGNSRGELVTVDLELRGKVSVSRRKVLTQRRTALLGEHAKTWWPWDVTTRQRGGFVVFVAGPLATLLEQGKAMFAAEPITEVEVSEVDEEAVADLVKVPWLSRVRRLVIRGEIGDQGFAKLVGSKQLEALTSLNVVGNGISDVTSLGSKLPHLQTLALTANPLGDEGACSLLKWKHLEQLRTLYLSACELTGDGVIELFASGRLVQLAKLAIGSNDDISRDLRTSLRPAPALERVDF